MSSVTFEQLCEQWPDLARSLRLSKKPLMLHDVNGDFVIYEEQAHLALQEKVRLAEDIRAIATGLKEFDEGKDIPLHAAVRELRAKYGL